MISLQTASIVASEPIVDSKLRYLQSSRLFANLPADAIANAAAIFTIHVLGKRTRLFDQGDATTVVFLIQRGRVRTARRTADGKEATVAILGPGAILGEDAIFGRLKRTTVATCLQETLVCRTRAQDLLTLLGGSSALVLNLAQMLSDRLNEVSATIEDLAYTKISNRLLNLFERLAGESGVPVEDGLYLDLRLTHQEIASIIGCTRETVSLEINHLVRAGQIKQKDGYITVLQGSQP